MTLYSSLQYTSRTLAKLPVRFSVCITTHFPNCCRPVQGSTYLALNSFSFFLAWFLGKPFHFLLPKLSFKDATKIESAVMAAGQHDLARSIVVWSEMCNHVYPDTPFWPRVHRTELPWAAGDKSGSPTQNRVLANETPTLVNWCAIWHKCNIVVGPFNTNKTHWS